MTAPPRSRIPRAPSTATAPPPAPAPDENAPPTRPTAATTRAGVANKGVRVSAIPLAPATKHTRSAIKAHSTLATTRHSTAPAPPVAHVVVQGPSSDPPAADGPDSLEFATTSSRPGFHDERDDDGHHEHDTHTHHAQMPTPPNSQESSSHGEAVLTDQGDQGLLAPARTTRRTRSPSSQPSTSRATTTTSSRRLSRSPAAEAIPEGPSHAPHILAARRRSSMSVSPHPPSTSTSSSTVAVVASTSTAPSSSAAPAPKAKAKPKGKGTKLRPRPSELLAAPLAAPDADDADGDHDPLLLLGPEHTRGRGEGKRHRGLAAQAHGHGRASYAPSASARASMSGRGARADEAGRAAEMARLPTPPATQEDDDVVPMYQPLVFGVDETAREQEHKREQNDPADLGGFDAPNYYEDVGPVEHTEPHVAEARPGPAEVEPTAQDGMHDDDEGGFGHLDEADSSAGGYSSDDDAAAVAAPTSLASGQVPTVRRTRPSYPPLSPNRTGEWDGTVAVELGSSPPPPMREPTPGFGGVGTGARARRRSIVGARSRPSYPPLSPNTTGEFDSRCPVRLDSSPPPSPSAGESDNEVDGEAARGRPASSEWRDEVDADEVKVEDEQVVEDAFLAPRRSTPVPSTSTSTGARATTTSTPSNLLFLSAFRSPSPAISPIPRPSNSSRSPHQPQLHFVSPRKTLDHLTNLVVPSPSSVQMRTQSHSPSPLGAPSSSTAMRPTATITAAPAAALARSPSPGPSASAPAPPRSTWTRGPAFFRSSSFSPPARAALPRTATLYARRPGQDEGDEEEEGEGSREYHRFADLTATSPMPVGEGEGATGAHEAQEERGEENEGGEADGAGLEPETLEREEGLNRSASPALAQPQSPPRVKDDVGPPTPAKDRHSSPAAGSASRAADVDEAMASPASSTGSMRSSRHASLASPARSLNGDVLMSSPSPRNSPAAASAFAAAQARSPGSPSASASDKHDGERLEAQQLASTPGRRLVAGDDDARMASPSPARQGSPLKARLGELVDGGRTKLQGLLFGPRASTPRAPTAEGGEGEGDEAQAHDEPAQQARVEEQDDVEDEPFQLQPAPTKAHRPRAPASLADSTFTSHSHSRSHASFDSSASTTTSHRRRRRPSHPTLPIIEITSTDPRAAARAAAILKVHHKYVEQGFTAVDAARAAASAFDAAEALADEAGDSEDEEELRTLLLDAEDELRDQAPHAHRSTSVSTAAAPSTTATAAAAAGARWTSHEWRKLEQALVELGRRQRRATSAASSMGARSMRSESIAMASVVGDECDPETVVKTFLRSVGATRDECVGDWAWDTLIIRVEALKARRAKDARQRRASSFASTSHASSRQGPRAQIEERVEGQQAQAAASASEDGESDHEPTPEAHPVVKQELLSDDDDLGAGPVDVDSDASDEDGELGDDTFFSSSKRDRPRRGSVEPVYVPTALANPALRHLYDDFQPEKPKLPLKDLLREDSPSSSSADEGDERDDHTSSAPRESTPGAAGDINEPPRSPSSAQRLMSYLGSFVRRSPAPAPSPASSTRALPADSSASPSPSPEMQQVQLSGSLVTPRFASTAKPYPPLPASATHKPLPPVAGRIVKPLPQHRVDASTSRSTLDNAAVADAPAAANESTSVADTSASSANSSTSFTSSRRRRRSSGEGNSSLGRVWAAVDAIEEAESSREEEESRIIELLRTGSAAKRRAAGGDLRERTDDVSSASASAASGSGSVKGPRASASKGKGREVDWRGFVELDEELGRGMIPSGARALDRRVSGERRVSRR
ncbi:hypothetical protein JCM8208_007083 [Rhodotorula glutinis]